MVHRWIAGDVPIYLKFALKVTHPFRIGYYYYSTTYLLYLLGDVSRSVHRK